LKSNRISLLGNFLDANDRGLSRLAATKLEKEQRALGTACCQWEVKT